MIAHISKRVKLLVELDFIRFCIVGGVGFLINLGLLVLLSRLFGIPLFIAQLISAEFALFCNFLLHDNWTYRSKRVKKSALALITQFHATSWPAIIGSSFMVAGSVRYLHLSKVAALMISSVVALGWNFVWSKYIIWKDTPSASLNNK